MLPLLLLGVIIVAKLAPEQLKWFLGIVDAKPRQPRRAEDEPVAPLGPVSQFEPRSLPPSAAPPFQRPPGGGFGRKGL